MLRKLFLFVAAMILPFVTTASAEEASYGRLLKLNVEETGVYKYCLSFEDARVERAAREKAISSGLTLQEYREIAPNTRCYKNTITFVPLQPEPQLDAVGFVYKPDDAGPYSCPDKSGATVRCSIGTGLTRTIKAQLYYGKMRFPVYVELTNAQLAGGN